MKKTIVSALVILALGWAPCAHATLTVVGTATYDQIAYNVIFEGNLGSSGLVWLDYRNYYGAWQDHVNWAANVGTSFTVTLNPAYTSTIDWTTGWRLPATMAGPYTWGYDGTTTAGYNITTSELGHLYYVSLGNIGFCGIDGVCPQPGWTDIPNTGLFQHLYNDWYWSGAEYSDDPQQAWSVYFAWGQQQPYDKYSIHHYSMAVHPGTVSSTPIPATLFLLASGFAGLLGCSRRWQRK